MLWRLLAPCHAKKSIRFIVYRYFCVTTLVGGCSPFGLRKAMPVYMEKSILEIERIFINGGKRGFLVGMAPREVVRVVKPVTVSVALDD